jgi:hypothetical protein
LDPEGLEFDVAVEGGFVGETLFTAEAAVAEAMRLKREDPEQLVTVVVSVRLGVDGQDED